MMEIWAVYGAVSEKLYIFVIMKRRRIGIYIMMLLCAAAGAMAQSNRTRVKLLMPLVFDKQKVVNDTLKSPSIQPEKNTTPALKYDRF